MAGGLKVDSTFTTSKPKSKLAALRKGVPMHKNITLGVGENTLDVVIVLLSSDDMLDIEQATEEYCRKIGEQKNNRIVRNNYYNRMLASIAMRDPSDPTLQTLMVEHPDEVGEWMDIEDIDRVCTAYKELLSNKVPKMELLTEEQLDEIKNFLRVTPWKDLSTTLRVHLKSCHQTIVSEG